MSYGRTGYDDDGTNIHWINWRGAVASAIRGRRGQEFLRELLSALDAMETKALIRHELCGREKFSMSLSHWGIHDVEIESQCALGVIGKRRGLDLGRIDVDDFSYIHTPFGIANAMAREIEFVNDDMGPWGETPIERYRRVRSWVEKQLGSPMGAKSLE